MANGKATINEIPLNSVLNLSKNKALISNYEGFNRNNSPYYASMLSPLYIKEGTSGKAHYYDGHEYTWDDTELYKDGSPIWTFPTKTIVKKDILTDVVGEVLAVYDETHYVLYKNNTIYSVSGTDTYTLVTDVVTLPTVCECMYLNGILFICIDEHLYVNGTDKGYFGMYLTSVSGYLIGFNTGEISSIRVWDYNVNQNVEYCSLPRSGYYTKDNDFIYTVPKMPLIGRDSEEETTTINIGFHVDGIVKVDDRISATGQTMERKIVKSIYSVPISSSNRTYDPVEDSYKSTPYYSEVLAAYMTEKVRNYGSYWISGMLFHNYNSSTTNKAFLLTSSLSGYFAYDVSLENPFGSYRTYNGWNLLYNEGVVTGISVNEDSSITPQESTRGTLVCPWADVMDSYQIQYTSDFICYRSRSGKWVMISKSNVDDLTVTIENDVIYTNTYAFLNAYDLKSSTSVHYADDWNDRIAFDGKRYNLAWFSVNDSEKDFNPSSTTKIDYYDEDGKSHEVSVPTLDSALSDWGTSYYLGSAVNYGYENTKRFIDLSMFYPVKTVWLWGWWDFSDGAIMPASKSTSIDNVDLYFGSVKKGSCSYRWSYSTYNKHNKNPLLEGTEMSLSDTISYNLPINTEYRIIRSYTNNDLAVINGEAYPLAYNFTQPIYQYKLFGGIEGASDVFVIQGQTFMIINNKIYTVSYDGYQIAGTSVICDINGMQYLGATDKTAYFFCPMNKKIRAFNASNTVEDFAEASEIGEIYSSYFNPQTEAVYVAADTGLYVISSNNMFKLDITGITGMEFGSDYSIVYTEDKSYRISYEDKEGFTKQPVIVNTMLYGSGSYLNSVNDCIYIRLYDKEKKSGKLAINIVTYTDEGKQTETKVYEIRPKDWDEITDQFYVRYQPRFQAATGFGVNITSDFAIASIAIGTTPQNTQISKANF